MPSVRRRTPWGCLIFLAVIVVAGAFGWREYQRQLREHPEKFPWTALDLSNPVGRFTRMKLVALRDDPQQCRAMLTEVGDRDRPLPARTSATPDCGVSSPVEVRSDGPRLSSYDGGLVTACPVAAALRLWERTIVQPAAERILGARVARIEHFGSYSCRRLYGRSDGGWSEHATAHAVDIAGFRLSDGTRVSVLRDWNDGGRKAEFLRAVRDGACDLFATSLSPDYNSAHADHLHLDLAARGKSGWSVCR